MASIVCAKGVTHSAKSRKKPEKPKDTTKAFLNSLSKMGFKSLQAYLASEHWQLMKEWYFRIDELPKHCIVCQSKEFDLYHWKYQPLEQFLPCDLVPMCQDHAQVLQEYQPTGDIKILEFLRRKFPDLKREKVMEEHFRLFRRANGEKVKKKKKKRRRK